MKTFTHGGNIYALAERLGKDVSQVLDFSASINPLGPPDWFQGLIQRELKNIKHYPDPYCKNLLQVCSTHWDIPEKEVMAGNGSTELLYTLCRALEPGWALIPVPSYTDYERVCSLSRVPATLFALNEEKSFLPDTFLLDKAISMQKGSGIVFLGHPNNPTGCVFPAESLYELALAYPKVWFVLDEAFLDFAQPHKSFIPVRPENVIVLYSMTKFYALPGLRLGLGFAAPRIIERILEYIPPWSVNTLAQAAGVLALQDKKYQQKTREKVHSLRENLALQLQSLPEIEVFPSVANFLLCRVSSHKKDAAFLEEKLSARGIAIRNCSSFTGLGPRYFRVAVRLRPENEELFLALKAILSPDQPVQKTLKRKKTPALMLQGCTSNAGKSVLTAALCRIFHEDGVAVAPFKSQNMALNSFVTEDGLEMGRAQATQAVACGLKADVRMNPVLLKPSSDLGSQVIVMGKPVGNMTVKQYIAYKPKAFDRAKKAYSALAAEHDLMLLEGAGSPAEINLKAHDIVNMNMARYAKARVLLTGDIDRGGVFAAFVGTVGLLQQWEQNLIAGFIVNFFRGDASLLDEALEKVSWRTGIPFLGVVPFLPDLNLPEEDSLAFKQGRGMKKSDMPDAVEVAVLDMGHISNFTDFDALRAEPDVSIRIIGESDDLGRPDVVLLPGSKNVIADLMSLRAKGRFEELQTLAGTGQTEIVGICGGLQMLGHTIADPLRLEAGGMVKGIGLLDIETTLYEEKILLRVAGRHKPSKTDVTGYEIHHGRTWPGEKALPVILDTKGQPLGFGNTSGLVWGTYLHGIFDADVFRRWFINKIRERKGYGCYTGKSVPYSVDSALGRLAAHVRQVLDMDAVYKIIGM